MTPMNEAKLEMKKSLPIIVQLLNNPTFVKNLEESGYKINVPGIIDSFREFIKEI